MHVTAEMPTSSALQGRPREIPLVPPLHDQQEAAKFRVVTLKCVWVQLYNVDYELA